MSVYNQEDYLHDSINSILNQTFRDFDFLIINDGSTDKSVEIIESFSDKRIRFINNSKNIGLISSLNIGLSESLDAKYIARMDSDDIAYPTRLEEQLKILDDHTQIGLLGTGVKYFGDNLKSYLKYPPVSHRNLVANLICQNPFYHPTMMIRNRVLIENGLHYSTEFPKYDDYALWIDMIGTCEFANIQKVLLNYRRHELNEGAVNNRNYELDVELFQKIMLKLSDKLSFKLSVDQLSIISVITSPSRAKFKVDIGLEDILALGRHLKETISSKLLSKEYLMFKFFERSLLYFLINNRKVDAIKLISKGNYQNALKLVYNYSTRKD